jgi:hypothetical protein
MHQIDLQIDEEEERQSAVSHLKSVTINVVSIRLVYMRQIIETVTARVKVTKIALPYHPPPEERSVSSGDHVSDWRYKTCTAESY